MRLANTLIVSIVAALACAPCMAPAGVVISVKFVVGTNLPCSGDTTLTAGDMQNADGNTFTGQVGTWNPINIGTYNGYSAITDFLTDGSGAATTAKLALGNATGVADAGGWRCDPNEGSGATTTLRSNRAYIYNPVLTPDHYAWAFTGLEPNMAYKLVFFGNASASAIGNVANGVSAVLDTEGDWNWESVTADGAGTILGNFQGPTNNQNPGLFGAQIIQVTKPMISKADGDWSNADTWENPATPINPPTDWDVFVRHSVSYSATGQTVASLNLDQAASNLQIAGGASLTTGNAEIKMGTLAVNGALNASTLTVSGTGAATLASGSSGTMANLNVTAGTSTITSGTNVALTNLNVSGGTVSLGQTATPVGTLSVTASGTVNVQTGGIAAIVPLSAKGATPVLNAPAGKELAVTNKLTQGDLTISAGANAFKVGGANVVNNIDTLILQGGTVAMSYPALKVHTFTSPTTQAWASSQLNPTRGPEHTIDGSGLSGTWPSQVCDNTYEGTIWDSSSATGQWIKWDLGSVTTLTKAHVWNGNRSGQTARGIQTADIEWSDDDSTWTTTVTAGSFAQAPGTNDYAGFDDLDFANITGRYIRLNNIVNWGATDRVDLSEIQFYEQPVLADLSATGVVATSGTSSILDIGITVPAVLGNLTMQPSATMSFASAPRVSLSGISATGPGASEVAASSAPIAIRTGGNLDVATGATLTVRAVLEDDGSNPTALTKIGNGKAVLTGANSYIGKTTVKAGTLQLATSAQSVVLSGTGSDIQGGKMVLEYSGTAPDVRPLLKASYDTGWTGGKFMSTTADASHGLGWADNGVDQVKVAYTFYGDATLDGSVDATDLAKVLANYNQLSGMVWSQGDFDYNATVDATDLAKVLANYNQGPIVPGITALGTAAGFTVVPEPSTLVLLSAGLVALAGWMIRRRK